jgi:transcriptional regulator with XRE-family HTH domain
MDVVQPSPEVGQRLRRLRISRGKSLDVLAGLAGLSQSYLSMVENGQRALDRLSVIVALANALEIAPSEIIALPVPAPANGDTDSAVHAVRRALRAVDRNRPGGQVLPVEVLRARVQELLTWRDDLRLKAMGAALPALIRDLHTSIAAGRDVAELLDLAVLLHTQGATPWLRFVRAGVDLRSLDISTARQAAERRGDPVMLALVAQSDALVLLADGDFDLARDELDAVTVPTTSQDEMQVLGTLTLSRSAVDAADHRPADADAALDEAAELAEHTGEGRRAYWLGFGPTNVGMWRVAAVLESGDHEHAVAIGERLDPRGAPTRSHQAAYWVGHGRALARVRGRRDDAVRALRRAEKLSPVRTLRNPFVRDVLAELVVHAKRDFIGSELRGMAWRAGLPV